MGSDGGEEGRSFNHAEENPGNRGGWSFNYGQDDVENAKEPSEFESGTPTEESSDEGDSSDNVDPTEVENEDTADAPNPWILLGILSPLLGIVLFFSEEILRRAIISTDVAIVFLYPAYLVSLLLLLIDIRHIETKLTRRIGKVSVGVHTLTVLGITHVLVLGWYGSLTTTVIGWYLPVWLLSVLMPVSYVALRSSQWWSARHTDIGDREPNKIWVVGILSPALVLLFAAIFAYLREVLIISALSVPDRISELLMSFGYVTVLNLYTVACLVSVVSVIVDSRRTPDRLAGNKHYQAVVVLDTAALIAIFVLYFIGWEETPISGPGVVLVFYILIPASLVPAGAALWYVVKRQEVLEESRTSTKEAETRS